MGGVHYLLVLVFGSYMEYMYYVLLLASCQARRSHAIPSNTPRQCYKNEPKYPL